MDTMTCEQIEMVYEYLDIKQELQDVLMERAEDCNVECEKEEHGADNNGDGGDVLDVDDPDAEFARFNGGDDNLDETEFEAFFQSAGLQDTEQTSKDLFDMYDRDKDGLINLDEWKCLFCEIL